MSCKTYSTMDDIVTIKGSVVLDKRGKRFLLARIINCGDKQITSITFKLKERTSDGDYLGMQQITCKGLSISAGSEGSVAPTTLLIGNCRECDVEIVAACFGNYGYSKTPNGKVAVEYFTPDLEKKRNEIIAESLSGERIAVSKKRDMIPYPLILLCSLLAIFIICLVVIFSVNGFSATATEFNLNGIQYVFADGENTENGDVIITGYSGISKTLTITDTVDGHKVSKIEPNSFANAKYLETLTIDGMLSVDVGAFKSCSSLKTVYLDGVKKVEIGAFMYCTNLTTVQFNKITEIEAYAFYGCTNLNDFYSTTIETIGDYAFYDCGINQITILTPTTIKLGSRCFGGNDSNYSIRIASKINYNFESAYSFDADYSKTVLSTANKAESSSDLTSTHAFIIIGNESQSTEDYIFETSVLSEEELKYLPYETNRNDFFYNSFNVVELRMYNYFCSDYDSRAVAVNESSYLNFKLLFGGTSQNFKRIECVEIHSMDYIVPSLCLSFYTLNRFKVYDLKNPSVGSFAFANCGKLTSFESPKISSIGTYAFSETKIESFDFSEVSVMDSYAFYKNSSLKAVDLSDNITLTRIDAYTFSGCSSAKEIKLPVTLTDIYPNAFSDCSSLEKLIIPENVVNVFQSILKGCTALSELSLPSCSNFNANFNINSLFLTGAVTSNELPSSLKKITISKGNITENMFYGCSGVERILLYGNIYSIGASAFFGCSSLKYIAFPQTVTSIGIGALCGCEALEEMTLPFVGGSSIDNNGLAYLFYNSNYGISSIASNISKITLTGGENIPSEAFANMSKLKKVVLPSTLQTIDARAFANCYNISEITLPSTLQTINNEAFYGCTKLYLVKNLSALNVVIGSTSNGCVGLYALNVLGADETESSVTNGKTKFVLGDDGWYLSSYNVEDETAIVLPTSFTYEDNEITEYMLAPYLFAKTSIKSIDTSGVVKKVKNGVFSECLVLETADLSATESIGEKAFEGTASLNSIVVDDDLLSIDNFAFNESNIKSIIVPFSVTTLKTTAFDNSSLTSIYYGGTATDWSTLTSLGIDLPGSCEVYFYSECIHNVGNLWRYDSNQKPTTAESELQSTIITPATCTEVGKKSVFCPHCNTTETVEIPAIGHSFYANGTCKNCGKTRNYITNSNYSSADYDVTYNSFVFNSNLNYWQYSIVSTGTYTFLIQANDDIEVSFGIVLYTSSTTNNYTISSNASNDVPVTVSGATQSYYNSDSTPYYYKLSAGQTITITFNKRTYSASNYLRITDLIIIS